jgi:hypothetical protein
MSKENNQEYESINDILEHSTKSDTDIMHARRIDGFWQ